MPEATVGVNILPASPPLGVGDAGRTVAKRQKAGYTSTHEREVSQGDVVMVPLDRANLEMLRKLEAAGILNLGAVPVLDADARLATWTWDDFEQWMRSPVSGGRRKKRYADSTVGNTLRHAKRVTERSEAPVRLWPPDESSWLAHIEHTLGVQGKSESTLENPRKALHIIVERFLGLHWPSLDDAFEQPNNMREVPTPEMAWRLCTTKLAWFRYDDALFRHFNWLSQNVGQRTASEGAIFRLDRFQWDGFTAQDVFKAAVEEDEAEVEKLWKRALRRNCRLAYEQPKKRGRVNYRILDPDVVAARNTPSLLNWIVWHLAPRGRLGVHPEGGVVFPMFDGRTWPADYLGVQLGKAGRTVWSKFSPYSWRHYFAVELLLERFGETGVWDIDFVAEALDDEPRTVKRYYLRTAKLRFEDTLGAGIRRRPNRRDA